MLLIYGFNEACSNISESCLKVGDESMSVIRFFTMLKGGLSHLSYIFCKPEPLGTEFKTVACSVTGVLIFLPLDPYGGGGYGIDLVSFGVGQHSRLYQDIDGGDEEVGAGGLERVNEGLFSVRQLVLAEESSGGRRLLWC